MFFWNHIILKGVNLLKLGSDEQHAFIVHYHRALQ